MEAKTLAAYFVCQVNLACRAAAQVFMLYESKAAHSLWQQKPVSRSCCTPARHPRATAHAHITSGESNTCYIYWKVFSVTTFPVQPQ
eukprot:1149816-Pelagomonas_calceolata.AAC.7